MTSVPGKAPWYERFDVVYLYFVRWIVLAADAGFVVKLALDGQWHWSAIGTGGGLMLARSLKRDAHSSPSG